MDTHDHRPEYVITHDIGQRLQLLQSVGLAVPPVDDPLIVNGQKKLIQDMRDAIVHGKVVTIPVTELADEIIQIARSKWPDAMLVSACPDINGPDIIQLEVSRLYGLRGEFEGVGPRPGHPPLLEQAQMMMDEARERGMVLLEDGIFTGATVEHMIDRMKAKGATPLGLVAGFTFDRAQNVLNTIKGGRTPVVLARPDLHPVAWHPDRDFVPFVPGCGRVVGFTMKGRYRTNRFPLYSYDNASYSFPYLPQFSDSASLWTAWSGLPDAAAEPIGRRSLELAITIFEEIERLNGREITIEEVIGSSVRTCVALKVGESDFPPLRRRVIDYLSEMA